MKSIKEILEHFGVKNHLLEDEAEMYERAGKYEVWHKLELYFGTIQERNDTEQFIFDWAIDKCATHKPYFDKVAKIRSFVEGGK